MQEQFNLNFEASEPSTRLPIETLSDSELKILYKEKIGVSPRVGRDSRAQLIIAINNPEEEKAELQAIDTEDDRADLKRLHRH